MFSKEDDISSKSEWEQEKFAEECVGMVHGMFDDQMNEMREGIINDDDHSCSHLTLRLSKNCPSPVHIHYR